LIEDILTRDRAERELTLNRTDTWSHKEKMNFVSCSITTTNPVSRI